MHHLVTQYYDNLRANNFKWSSLSDKQLTVAVESDSIFFSATKDSFVTKMRDAYGNDYAVKCFFQNQRRANEHYEALANKSLPLSDQYFNNPSYYINELFFDGQVYHAAAANVIITRWINGCTLQEKIMQLSGNNEKDALHNLFQNFLQVAKFLFESKISHGDLSATNILITPDNDLRLIDYDTFSSPELKDNAPLYADKNSLQHPKKSISNNSMDADYFPLLIIAISLYSTAIAPELFKKYSIENSLYFDKPVLFGWTNHPLKKELENLNDAYLNNLLVCLQIALSQNNPALEDLPEYLFDNAPASGERQHAIKLALMKAEIYTSAHTINTLNNEIATRAMAEEKVRYEKKILEQEKQKLEAILKTKERNKRRNLRVVLPIVSAAGLISGAIIFFASHHNQQIILRGSAQTEPKEDNAVVNVVKKNEPPLIIDEKKDTVNNKLIAADSNLVADSSHKLIAPSLTDKDSLSYKEKSLVIANAKKMDTAIAINNDSIQAPINKISKYISSSKSNGTLSSSKKTVPVSFRSIE
ncbi:MAG TPA: RIO1 family regulatory kinase/ATPase [Puia sp.]|jgi:hypothetical protein|nr:RIO1 family regulatory kinase/ATPase [Puia sp.]